MFIASLLLVSQLAGQVAEGTPVFGNGCFSMLSNSQVRVAAAQVGVTFSSANRIPVQGAPFMMFVNVRAEQHACDTATLARVAVRLPAAFAHVPPDNDANTPEGACFMGAPGNLMAIANCPLQPTATEENGRLLYFENLARADGLWRIPLGQVLQIQVIIQTPGIFPIGFNGIIPDLQGVVDYVTYDGSNPVLQPVVPGRTFYNSPTINYPNPGTSSIEPYAFTGSAIIINHFNAGQAIFEVRQTGQAAFQQALVVDVSDALNTNTASAVFANLSADTNHEWRVRFDPIRANEATIIGGAVAARTLPAPRHAVTVVANGQGSIDITPPPQADGTIIDRTSTTVTPVPALGHTVASWSVNGSTQSGASNTTAVTAPLSVVATFEPIQFPISVTIEGPGSIVTDPPINNGVLPFGTALAITPVPAAGAELLEWSINGNVQADDTATLAVMMAMTVQARFALLPVVGEGEGEGSPSEGEGEASQSEGEGEGQQSEGEGEGQSPSEGEGEGSPSEGEGEGEGEASSSEGEGEGSSEEPPAGGCGQSGAGVVAMLSLAVRQRRRQQR